jgi:hypothetical protein
MKPSGENKFYKLVLARSYYTDTKPFQASHTPAKANGSPLRRPKA